MNPIEQAIQVEVERQLTEALAEERAELAALRTTTNEAVQRAVDSHVEQYKLAVRNAIDTLSGLL
jgi:hypothetical protein